MYCRRIIPAEGNRIVYYYLVIIEKSFDYALRYSLFFSIAVTYTQLLYRTTVWKRDSTDDLFLLTSYSPLHLI